MRRTQTLIKALRPVGAKRKCIAALSIGLISFIASACGGTGVPDAAVDAAIENGGGAGGINVGGGAVPEGEAALQQVDFSIIATVLGNPGNTTTSLEAAAKGSRAKRYPAASKVERAMFGSSGNGLTKNQGTGEFGSGTGSNGNDPVDMNGNNLNTGGLNQPVESSIKFIAEGNEALLGEIIFDGTAVNVDVGGKELGAGQNLIAQITSSAGVTRAVIPSLLFKDGGTFGFNVYLRNDASMVLEIFPDSAAPQGQSDNGARVMVDTKVDCHKNGNFHTVSRLETPDGMVFWDTNLDGNFGSPNDACILFDTNGDGQVTAADSAVAYAIDPNLDGTLSDGEERLLGNNIPEDFINNVTIKTAPLQAVANGLSTVTMGVDFEAAPTGSPVGAVIELRLKRAGAAAGEYIDWTPEERGGWVANDQNYLTRTLDPNNPNVTMLSDGSMRLLEALRVPVLLDPATLVIELHYAISDDVAGKTTRHTVPLLANEAPILTKVDFFGTAGVPANSSLENASREARVVEGNPVDLNGANFSNDPMNRPLVTFGGVPAFVNDVNPEGTKIFTTVPVGAKTGPIAVLQDGVGAQTSQNFVVGGMPLRFSSTTPADQAVDVDVNTPVIVRFNQPISPAGVEDGFLVETSGGMIIPGNTEVSEDGLTITHRPNQPLAASTSFVVSLTSALRTTTGIHFDNIVGDTVLNDALFKTPIGNFTTGATPQSDMIAPTLDLPTTTLDAPTEEGGPFSLNVSFSERISPGTFFTSATPTSADSVRLRDDVTSNLVPMAVKSISEDGLVFSIEILGELRGRQTYSLELSPTITDIVGNALTGSFLKSFSTALRIDRFSAVSGPIGTRLLIEGSTFSANQGDVTVNFAGETGPVAALLVETTETTIELEVPVGAIDGMIEINVSGESTQSFRPFVVTASGYDPRVIAEAAGAFGIALDVDGRALVSYQGSGQVGFLDVPSEREVLSGEGTAKLNIGGVPTDTQLNSMGTLGFTTNYGPVSEAGESVFVIDMDSRAVLSSIRVGRRPTRIALSPDDRRLYVTNNLDDTVSVVDLSSNSVIGEISTGAGPNGVAIAPNNAYGYVTNYLENTVTVFDTASYDIRGTIVVGDNPARVMISPDATRLFVSNFGSNTITVIDAQTLKILQTIPGLAGPSAMVFDPNGARFFVTNRNSNTIQEVMLVNDQWELTELKIATENVPAGLVITSDGSLLAYTTEGAGKVSVVTVGNPRLTLSNLRVDNNGQRGQETLSADSGRRIWVEGRGFGGDHNDLTVRLGERDLLTFSDDFSSRRVLVQIPSDATSGPLTISRARNTETLVSNDIALLITARSPQVQTMTPGDGSRGVPRDVTIVIEMSEPLDLATIFREDGGMIDGANGQPVMRVRRLDAVDGEDEVVSGSWQADAFGRRFEFTRPISPTTGLRDTFFSAESNNAFEVVVSPSIKDLFGNAVIGALTTFGSASETQLGSITTVGNEASRLGFRGRFVTDDQRGPRIVKALYRDIDGNGPDVGDEVEVEFDEDLLYNGGVFGNGSLDLLNRILFTNGSSGATLAGRPGSNPQRVVLTLGTNAVLTFGDNATTVNAGDSSTQNSISQFTDYSGQRPTAGTEVPVRIDPRFDNLAAPRLLYSWWSDLDTSTTVNAGDEVLLYFSEAVVIGASATAANILQVTNGALAGASIIARQPGDDLRQIRVLLGAGSVITPDTTTITLVDDGNGFVAENTITDLLGTEAHASLASEVQIRNIAPPSATIDTVTKPRHIDVQGTKSGLSEGDVIVISFTGPVLVNRNAGDPAPGTRFKLGVKGDRFGFGARIAQPAFVNDRSGTPIKILSNQIVIVLGKQPVLTFTGEFGIDLSE